jgi:hypothetical protein
MGKGVIDGPGRGRGWPPTYQPSRECHLSNRPTQPVVAYRVWQVKRYRRHPENALVESLCGIHPAGGSGPTPSTAKRSASPSAPRSARSTERSAAAGSRHRAQPDSAGDCASPRAPPPIRSTRSRRYTCDALLGVSGGSRTELLPRPRLVRPRAWARIISCR